MRDEEKASISVLKERKVIRYEFIPGKIIKHIYTLKTCILAGKVETPHAPAAPVFNSNFDSSFIACILQLRMHTSYRWNVLPDS